MGKLSSVGPSVTLRREGLPIRDASGAGCCSWDDLAGVPTRLPYSSMWLSTGIGGAIASATGVPGTGASSGLPSSGGTLAGVISSGWVVDVGGARLIRPSSSVREVSGVSRGTSETGGTRIDVRGSPTPSTTSVSVVSLPLRVVTATVASGRGGTRSPRSSASSRAWAAVMALSSSSLPCILTSANA